MKPFTISDMKWMLSVINRMLDEISGFIDASGYTPLPDSPAAKELSSYKDPELVSTAYASGHVLIDVAADNLMAFTRLCSEPALAMAPWTCIRVVLETSAYAIWLLDPSLSAQDRVSRSLGFRYESLVEGNKWAEAVNRPADLERGKKRIEEVERRALADGFSPRRNKKGELSGIGTPLRSAIELLRDISHDDGTYRLLSGMTHGYQWAIQKLCYEPVEGESESMRTKTLRIDSVMYLCSTAVPVFVRPVWYRCQLFGWDAVRLAGILDSAFTAMQLRKDLKFWERQK